MNTKNELTAIEIQNEINSELSKLVKTSFNSDYENRLSNLIDTMKQLTDNIYEKMSYLTDPIYANDNTNLTTSQKNSLEQIHSTLFCLDTIFDVTKDNIKPDDFLCLSNLIHYQKKLSQLDLKPNKAVGLSKDEEEFLTK